MSTSSLSLPVVRRHMVFLTVWAAMLSFFPLNVLALSQSSQIQPAPAAISLKQSLARKIFFSIRSTSLRSALLEFSKQSGIQLIYVSQKKHMEALSRLEGPYSIKEALEKLLHGTGFEYEFTEANTVTIRERGGNARTPDHLNSALSPLISKEDYQSASNIEEIISLGSRARGRTALKTPVPVDIMNETSLISTGETETGRILQSLAPSFNFSSSSISDGTDAIKPATLRGLGPDQTLVLINGKRRHTSALVHVNTSVGRGATGVDMNAIPPSAIKRIEVLRDGATAQYGSDAIAGVINIILKDQNNGGNISTYYGQTYKGDGGTFVTNASYGTTIAGRGNITLSAEYRKKDFTNRAGLTGCLQYETGGQQACAVGNIAINPKEAGFNRQNFRVGDSGSTHKSFVANMTLPVGNSLEFYMLGTYSERDNQSAGFYRRANDPGRTVIEIYPNGFLPLINSKIQDYSILAGTRWSAGDGWSLESSIMTGSNHFHFQISNSLNASFGATSPTSADAGALQNNQTTINFDVSKSFDLANIAFGTEWRHEKYSIIAGDPISYENGGALNYNCPGCDVTPIAYRPGFQVFKGFSTDNALRETRDNFAAYTDVEVGISTRFMLTVAARYEHYSDFGSRLNAKLAARYEISPVFAVRSSLSSGFRAPSMQQKFFNSTSTQFVEVNGVSVAQERGTFRNDSTVARALKIPKLKIETAVNYSLGFVTTPAANLTITADYYRIDINDRIAISGSIPIRDNFPAVTAKTGATEGQFFTNMASTLTQGIDFVANYDVPLPAGQSLKFSLAANKTQTRIKKGSIASPLPGVDALVLFSPQDRSIIEEWQPSSRVNFTVEYNINNWSLLLRNNYYGSYIVCEGSCDILSGRDQNIQKFTAKTLTDLQISYHINRMKIQITIGANNLFNIYPDRNVIGQARSGSIKGIVSSPGVFTYSRRSAPFGYNGGYYYLRIDKSF